MCVYSQGLLTNKAIELTIIRIKLFERATHVHVDTNAYASS